MIDQSVAASALAPLVREPARSGLFCDFDGTLSEIVDEPADARPLPGVPEALGALGERFGCVAVLSGRPVDFIEAFFGPSVLVAGLYGLQVSHRGEHTDHPLGGAWREVIDDVASTSSARGPAGMRVEPKGLSLTLHYRGNPTIEAEVRAWADQQAARSGLVVRPARMSYELHPPIAADKGTALLDLAVDLGAVCFIGDDVGDLPAFDALDRLGDDGIDTVRIGVRSAEESDELIERADVLVDGPRGVLELLEHLRGAAHEKAS